MDKKDKDKKHKKVGAGANLRTTGAAGPASLQVAFKPRLDALGQCIGTGLLRCALLSIVSLAQVCADA